MWTGHCRGRGDAQQLDGGDGAPGLKPGDHPRAGEEPGAAERVRADRHASGPAGQAEPQHDPGAGDGTDSRGQGGRTADPRVRHVVGVHRGADRGSTGAAVAARRLRRPRQPAAAAGERRGVALSAGQGRHQDETVPADTRAAPACGDRAPGTARGDRAGGRGAGVLHCRRAAARRGERAPLVPGSMPGRGDRAGLDAPSYVIPSSA